MIDTYQDHGLDRRVLNKFNATLNDFPHIAKTFVTQGDPFDMVTTDRFFELVDGQIELCLDGEYSLCLLLIKMKIDSKMWNLKDAINRSAAQLVSLNLRPTDILLRYPSDSLSVLLHGTNMLGGQVVAKRLSLLLVKGMKNSLTASCGIAVKITNGPDRAQKFLCSAEADRLASI